MHPFSGSLKYFSIAYVAFAMPNSPYVLIGFEDLVGGGDLDYNDALFVVDIGMVNATSLIDDPTSLPQ